MVAKLLESCRGLLWVSADATAGREKGPLHPHQAWSSTYTFAAPPSDAIVTCSNIQEKTDIPRTMLRSYEVALIPLFAAPMTTTTDA